MRQASKRRERTVFTICGFTRICEEQLFLTEKLRSNLPTRLHFCENGQMPAPLGPAEGYSKIRIAAAITVVQRPRLSPMADCVTFAVRTIMFEMR